LGPGLGLGFRFGERVRAVLARPDPRLRTLK